MFRNYGRYEDIQKAMITSEFIPYLLERMEEMINQPKIFIVSKYLNI